jgi:hypothetical protein
MLAAQGKAYTLPPVVGIFLNAVTVRLIPRVRPLQSHAQRKTSKYISLQSASCTNAVVEMPDGVTFYI